MRCALALCVALAWMTACGGVGEETAPPKERTTKRADGENWGRGWGWKGKAEDCFFRVGNSCFDALDKACKAADCGDRKCIHDDAAPARVMCEGDDPEALDRAFRAGEDAADEDAAEEAADEAAEDAADEAREGEGERNERKRRKKRRRRR